MPVVLRPTVYATLIGVVLTAFCWFVFPLAAYAVWIVTLFLIVASLTGLAIMGIARLARRTTKTS